MTSGQRSLVGMSMLAVGLLLVLAAAGIAWSGVQRWLAVSETRDALEMLRRDRVADARKLAAKALARVPDEVAPALLALDMADLDAVERIEAVAARGANRVDRETAHAAMALARVAKGKAAGFDLEGSADGRLLAAMAAANAGRDPGRLKPVDGEAPPHLNVLRAAHTVLLRRAWQAGKVSEVRAHAGALLLLRPRAPEAPLMHLLVGAGSALLPDAEAIKLCDAVKQEQEAAIRAVAALLPQRRAAIATRWPKAVEGLP